MFFSATSLIKCKYEYKLKIMASKLKFIYILSKILNRLLKFCKYQNILFKNIFLVSQKY